MVDVATSWGDVAVVKAVEALAVAVRRSGEVEWVDVRIAAGTHYFGRVVARAGAKEIVEVSQPLDAPADTLAGAVGVGQGMRLWFRAKARAATTRERIDSGGEVAFVEGEIGAEVRRGSRPQVEGRDRAFWAATTGHVHFLMMMAMRVELGETCRVDVRRLK